MAPRDDERAWLEVTDRLSTRPCGAAGSPLLRALRADVHLFHGRRDLAAEQLTLSPWDVPGLHRSTYAAVRAEVLGGETLDDDERLMRGDQLASAVLARARGDFDAALVTFRGCDAAFEVARTRVMTDPEDGDARAALDCFVGHGEHPDA